MDSCAPCRWITTKKMFIWKHHCPSYTVKKILYSTRCVSLLNIYNNLDTFAYLGFYLKVSTTSVLTKWIAQFKEVNYQIHHSGRKYCFVSVLFVFLSVQRVFHGFLKSLWILHPGAHGTPGHLNLSLPSSLFFFFFFIFNWSPLIPSHCTPLR